MEIEEYGINEKQYRFVQHYVALLNPAEAAKKAGLRKEMGTALLSRPEIQDAIQAFKEKLDTENIMSAQETLENLTTLAKTSMNDIYDMSDPKNPTMKTITEETMGAVQEVELTSDGNVKKMKMYNRQEALRDMGRHHGLFTVKHEHSGPKGKPIEVNHKYNDLDEIIDKMDEMIKNRGKIKQVEIIDIEVTTNEKEQ